MLKRVLMILVGILAISAGTYIIADPALSLPLLGAMMAAGMFLFSVSAIMAWFRRRADGQADGFTLFIAILGFIFSLMFLANIWAQIMTAEIMFYMSLVFAVAEGVGLIVDAFRIRRLKDAGEAPLQQLGASWGWILAGGILLLIAGIFALSHPVAALFVMGIYMGIEIIMAGVSAILMAFQG